MTIKKFRIDSGFTKLLDALTVNGCVALNVREEKKRVIAEEERDGNIVFL